MPRPNAPTHAEVRRRARGAAGTAPFRPAVRRVVVADVPAVEREAADREAVDRARAGPVNGASDVIRSSAARRSSGRSCIEMPSSTASPSSVMRMATERPTPVSCRSTSPLDTSRSTRPTTLWCFSCNRSARSVISGGAFPGKPLIASNAWWCCGGTPASRAASSLKRSQRRR